MRYLLASLLLCVASWNAHSQDLEARLVQIDLGREYGWFSKSPAVLRAVSIAPTQAPPKTALLFFPGWPGILWLPENMQPQQMISNSPKSRFYATRHIDLFPSKGITFVMVDCPTDQWGTSQRSRDPYGCSDTYRSSEQHANDVQQLIQHLRATQGIEKFFVMGHSYGSVSSRWLAIRLGQQIQGSIHSASMTQYAGPRFADYGSSVARMNMDLATAPWIYVHNQQDQCANTAYLPNKAVAGSRLITLRGGTPEGDPCGGGHYHSYQGRELEALNAIAHWVLTGEVIPFAGEP